MKKRVDMDDAMKVLATQVRAARKARNWTQQDLADAAGVKLGMVNNFETHKTTPQPGNLRSILTVLDLGTEAGDDTAASTRDEWPADVRVFLDVIGVYLSSMGEEQRLRVIHDLTRQIVRG